MNIEIPRQDADYSDGAISKFGFKKGDKVYCDQCACSLCSDLTVIGVASSVDSNGRLLLWTSGIIAGKEQANYCMDAKYEKQP